jgi:hypothetical protein
MKIFIFVAVVMTVLHAQEVSRTSATPSHFRWSEAQSHELDYGRTIKTSPDLSTAERAALTNVVLQQLILEGDLEDMTEKQARVIAGETRVELVDLNGDGKPEIIAQANGLGPCGGTGNCIFWIFERTADGLKPLLNTTNRTQVTFEKILIRPWSTSGYKDIVLGSHSNASSRNLVWFQFTRGAYRIHACYYSTWTGEDLHPLNTPAIWQEKCAKSLGPIHSIDPRPLLRLNGRQSFPNRKTGSAALGTSCGQNPRQGNTQAAFGV